MDTRSCSWRSVCGPRTLSNWASAMRLARFMFFTPSGASPVRTLDPAEVVEVLVGRALLFL